MCEFHDDLLAKNDIKTARVAEMAKLVRLILNKQTDDFWRTLEGGYRGYRKNLAIIPVFVRVS